MRAFCLVTCALAAVLLAAAPPAGAELRITDLDVFLNDYEVTAHVVLLGAIPSEFHESLHSGVPTHVRFTIELWQYNFMRPDRRLLRTLIERTLTYNVVTKEYKVTHLKGEPRAPYTTRELRDAQRVLSEARNTKLMPVTSLNPTEVFYLRVYAETALNGDASWVARMSGTAEQTSRQSEYRTLTRVQ
jgi:hypothetical protein